MKNIFVAVIILALISVASAAVYMSANPEARIYFDREQPGPDVVPVVTVVQMSDGVWVGSYGYGTMTDEILNVSLMHRNTAASIFTGLVYFEIECIEGLVDNLDGIGIRDFKTLEYTDVNGNVHSCNTNEHITRLSDTKIRVVPTIDTYDFVYGVYVPSSMHIEFIPYAYGEYNVFVFVDENVPI